MVNGNNSNSIHFIPLKSEWFSGPYMSDKDTNKLLSIHSMRKRRKGNLNIHIHVCLNLIQYKQP